MKIYGAIFYVISVTVLQVSVSAKSLIFSKSGDGVSNVDQQSQNDVDFEETKDSIVKNNVDSLLNSYKRSIDDLGSTPSYKRSAFGAAPRKRSPYGLVYNQGKPIGILEPIAQSFEYSNYNNPNYYRNNLYKSQWFPAKREADSELDDGEVDQLAGQTSALHSSNYANVLAKFKVNNKVKHRPYQDFLYSQQVKRDATSEKLLGDLKKRGGLDMGELQNKSKLDPKRSSVSSDKIEEIEENLKDVMGDMGLVEKDKTADAGVQESNNKNDVQKREIYFEDEDLENGLNKIGLTKESHYDRDKKEDYPSKSKGTKSIKSKKYDKSHRKLKKKKKEDMKDDQDEDTKRSTQDVTPAPLDKKSADEGEIKKRVSNYQYEGETYIRNKRQGKEAERLEDSDIMRGIESSGDLTVSGNKSPLVAVTSGDDPECKKSQEKRDKEELEYEKRLERNIQAKIDAIKEEVKREITKLKTEDTKLKDMQRKKRETANTLLDEETSALDPGINIDQKLDAYVRKRRDLEQDQQSDANVEESDKNERSVNVRQSKQALNEEDGLTRKIGDENSAVSPSKVNRETNGKSDELTQKSNEEAIEPNAKSLREVAPAKVPVVKKERNADDNKCAKAVADTWRETREVGNEAKVQATDTGAETELKKDLVKRSEEATVQDANVKLADEKVEKTVVKRNEKSTYINLDNDEGVVNSDVAATQSPQGVIKRSEQFHVTPLSPIAAADTELANSDNIVKRNQNVTELFDERSTSVDIGDASASTAVRFERQSENGNKSVDGEIRPERSATAKVKKSAVKQKISDAEPQKDARLVRNSETEALQNKTGVKAVEKRNSVEIENDAKDAAKAKSATKKNAPSQENEARSTRIELRSVNVRQGNEGDLNVDTAEDATDKKIEKLRSITSQNLGNANGKDSSSEGEVDSDAKFEDSLSSDANGEAEVSFDRSGRNANENVQSEGFELRRRRRRRREARRRNGNRYRRKRNEPSYSSGNPQMINYRADMDEDMDEEGDETEDDGFNDQTSNYMNKRQAKVFSQDNENYEADEVEDYPSYMERNKRNAMRHVNSEDDDADEYYDNFLFYPNRYTRRKRQSYNGLANGRGGENMMTPLEAIRDRNLRTLEKNSRRKRLEKVNNIHNKKQHDMAELSDSDIFGGLPQSYEGELSRFKRVKRSIKSH